MLDRASVELRRPNLAVASHLLNHDLETGVGLHSEQSASSGQDVQLLHVGDHGLDGPMSHHEGQDTDENAALRTCHAEQSGVDAGTGVEEK
jgi:hypothetical protein